MVRQEVVRSSKFKLFHLNLRFQGKTYSLLGGGWDDPSAEDNAFNDPMFYGVIPRCLNDIFDQIEKRSGCNESFNFNISKSCMIIFLLFITKTFSFSLSIHANI